jgi:D-alanyl-D-alanine carboxypeptidase/Putative peptidoglycan binding domain
MVDPKKLNPLFGPPCERRDDVPVEVFGTTIAFARRGANQLLRAAMRAYDLDYRVHRIESYNCRLTTGGGSRSAHSWPVAVDINPDQNPYSSTGHLKTNMPKDFIECFKKEGFGWGGDWHSVKDPMHFSLAPNEGGDPAPAAFDHRLQQRALRKWRDRHGGANAPPSPGPHSVASGVSAPPFPGHILSVKRFRQTKRPDDDVRKFQRRLKKRGWRIATDGKFTPAVERVVRAFQREKRLRVTGSVDRATWRMIWEAPVT